MDEVDAVWLVAGGEPGAERFGQLVQRLRKQKRMSVEELAEGAGLSVGTIRAIEQARRAPSQESGLRLLQLLLPEGALSVEPKLGAGIGQVRPDAAFEDPESGERVLLEFRAKTAGDNRRWSSDKPRATETNSEAAIRRLLADPARVEGMKAALAPLVAVISHVSALADRPASDEAIGKIMRRLNTANEIQLELVESLLYVWERALSSDADEEDRDRLSRLISVLSERQPFPDEIVEL